MNINLRQLRSLVAIARMGSFTRAAKDLHLSQPALTVQMHQLEEMLGVRLLDRNTRFVKLTSLGQHIVPIIERALNDIDTAIAGTRLTSESIGIVTIAALPSLCSEIIPMAIAKFREQYPGISIRLREVGARQIALLVNEEEADLGIGLIEHPHPQLETTPFITDWLVAVFPAGHPLDKAGSIAPADLAAYPMIALDTQYSVRSLFDSALHAIDALKSPAYEVSFISTAIGMVRSGLGITVLSSSSLGGTVTTGLRTRPVKHPKFSREIVIIKKRSRTLSPAAQSLLKTIQSVRNKLQSTRSGKRTAR
jgi:DNA-binding transcriptional LysR family regulator